MHKGMYVVFAVVIGILLLEGFRPTKMHSANIDQSASPTNENPIRIARYYSPGMYWIDIAKQKGWFQEEGLSVQFVDTNSDYYLSIQQMANGELVDVHTFALYDMLMFNIQGTDLVMVVNTDNSFGTEAIVARESISSIHELKGKTIAVSQNSYTEYILDVALSESGLTLNDVTLIDLPAVERGTQSFIEGKYDVIVTWEPYVSVAMSKGGSHSLFDTSQIKGISPNGQVFHQRFLDERPNDVQRYVNVWHTTTEYIKEHRQEAYQIIADTYGTTWEDVAKLESFDKILDLEQNLATLAYSNELQSLHGTVRNINRFMINRGITDKRLDSKVLIERSFIERLGHTLVQN